ncbi:PREDICTED: zinc finger protein RFP-like [Gekko japonicus]|uniref:Zinc finger protein RFP-like n=1 Tax=Gekko japonicus TaxID=146911 RepID=A0ABM1L1T3_GEKJA|nr:PREDICTED: zinc finger protein RFP-like [Gekko japonicus]
MASGGPVRELCEEVTCPICLEYFRDPATIAECGHNFCRACLTRSWGEAAEASCPMCKQTAQPRNLRANRQLANVVEIAKKLSLQGEEAEERICEKHREPLKHFCKTDKMLICRVCDRSKEHKNHVVTPAEKASQKYKDKIFRCMKTLRTEREEILEYIQDVEDESRELLKRTVSTRQDTVAEFRTLHQMLEEQENELLARIEEVEKEVARKTDEHLARLSEELSSLERLIQEMEEKHKQPVNELLQDVRGTLKRYEKRKSFENAESVWCTVKLLFSEYNGSVFSGFPEAFPSELKSQVCYSHYNPFLASAMKQFRDALDWAFLKLEAKVTLDLASASSHLVLSGDQKRMWWQHETQDLSEEPEKHYGFVLGSVGFTAGCHFWEVLVGIEEGWAVGVSRKPERGRVPMTPEEGIWAVGRWKGQYKAFVKGIDPPLTLRGELTSIRICVNYDGGRVAFFNAERAALLYEFSGASFCGETLHPFFAVCGDGWLSLLS